MIEYLTTSFFTIETFITFYVWFSIGFTTILILGYFIHGILTAVKSKNPMHLLKPCANTPSKNRKRKIRKGLFCD